MYVTTGKLIFKSYKPLSLEQGMYFLIRRNNEMVISQLDKKPIDDDVYIQDHGYPVEPFIVDEGNPNLNDGHVIAEPHEIGWWDVGEESDELYDITVKEINQIIENGGFVDVEVEEVYDDRGRPIPIIVNDKVIMSHCEDLEEPAEEDHYDDDYDEEYFFEDDEEYTPPSNDEWENQFLNPNHEKRYDED